MSSFGNWDKFQHSKAWLKKRGQVLRRYGYIDQYIRRTTGRTTEANVVHHILPKEQFPQYALESWNLISVSRHTHSRILHTRTGALSKAGKVLMMQTAIENGIKLQRVTLVIGLPGSGKTTWVRSQLGAEGIAYDLDAIAAAFRLTTPHAERHDSARHLANQLFKAFAQRAKDFSPDVYLIRTAGTVQELEQIHPDRLVVCRGQHRIENRKDYMPIDTEPLQINIEAEIEWAEANGIEVTEVSPPGER